MRRASRGAVPCSLVLVAVAGAWSSLVWSFDSVLGADYHLRLNTWRTEHRVSDAHFATYMVAGWPLQAIEGHGGGGAPEKLLPGKGLGAMHLNFLAWLTLGAALAWLLDRRVVSWVCGLAFLATPLAVGAGAWRLLLMLD
jgi:hypothetical protein